MLNHERIERQLASADLETSAAEVHGMLCGLLCCGCADAISLWFAELFQQSDAADLLVQECQRALRQLFDETRQAIEGPGLGFSPLLPDDQEPITERAKAVCNWSAGFLYGIGLAGVSPQRMLSESTREALKDFTEITRMDWQSPDGEEDEEALMEVSEFLWVGAMLVHDDLVPNETAKS